MINANIKYVKHNIINTQGYLVLIVLWISLVYCGVPVISDIAIFAGSKGIVLSVTADIPIDSYLVENSGSSVLIRIEGSLSDMDVIEYDKFTSSDAVKRVSIRGVKSGGETEINITLNTLSDQVIRISHKRNSWLALLSSKNFSELEWSFSEYQKKNRKTDSDSDLKTSNRILSSVNLLARGNISELFFNFDIIAESDIRRIGDTLIIRFNNAKNMTGSTFYNLPEETVFRSVKITEIQSDKKCELITHVVLNNNNSDSDFNIVCKKDRGFSLMAINIMNPKAVFWNSRRGLELGYDFYQMPSYEIDMKLLEKRALSDNNKMISDGLFFTIKEIKGRENASDNVSRQLEKVAYEVDEEPQELIQNIEQMTSESSIGLKVDIGSEIPLIFNGDSGLTGNSNGLIRYNRNGRDPFLPYNGYMESSSGFPYLDNLNLVGILFDTGDRIALLEDKKNQNRPFTLREEDKIEKGKVLKIYRDKVVFLITEYGISRSVILRLTNISSNMGVGKR